MRRFLLFALAATLFVACTKDAINEPAGIILDDNRTLTVSFEGDTEDTRIQLNEEKKSVWTEGDLLSVFYRSTTNEQWQFAGKTGDRTGNILPVDSGIVPTPTTNEIVVVYPYNAGYFYNSDTKNVQASLPAEQSYLKDSYGLDGNIMVSQSEYNQVSLKSVCGWLKLQLTGAGETVKSITLRGNAGEQVAGELYINTADATSTLASELAESDDDGEVDGTLVRPGTILTEVTLNCGAGVALGKEATSFYIALPPQTFEGGFTVDIIATDGSTMTKTTDKALTIERNYIQPMSAFAYTPSTPKPANNEIWYTNGSTTKPTVPYVDNFDISSTFGASLESNTYDAAKRCWVMSFYGDLTKIGNNAFKFCDTLTSIILPNSIKTIGDSAFHGCYNIATLNIPEGVTSIGQYAFKSCQSLTSVTIPDSVTSIGVSAFETCDDIKEFKGKYATDNGRCLVKDNTIIAYAEASGTTYTIPNGVTTIGDNVFLSCTKLTSVVIPNGVTTIKSGAFYDCRSLISITIPNSVTTIESAAIRFCTSLTSVTIPASVTSVGAWAFSECYSLKEVYCKATIPPTGGRDMFYYNASDRKIYVPASDDDSIIKAYKEASGWSEYKDYICEDESKPANNEIWYTATAKVEPYYTDEFGATYISNVWDSETGKGVITFSGDVTKIGYYAFYECSSLTSVTIPDSVTTIGEQAFYSCNSLTSVTIPDSVTTIGERAFNWCTNLTSVTIPNSVKTIGNYAFTECTSLTSVTIPDSVTTIGGSAFSNCSSLKEFKGKFAADNGRCLIMDNTIIAYANASGTTYTIPDSVTTIGDLAFYGCYSLTSVTIGNSVTTIGSHAFRYCSSLTSVTIGNSVTTIGNYAFYECGNLLNVTIGDSVTTIGYFAFSYCDSLTSVTIPDSVTTIGERAFYYCTSLESVTIGDSVTTIGKYAFFYCTSLTSVTIPDSVTSIGYEAFCNCYSLTSVTIPDSVTTIGNAAFSHCTSLTSVTIPDSVTSIGDYAFRYCTSLKYVYCKPTTPPTGGYDMFYNNAPGRKILVPTSDDDSIINAYKKALYWSSYASYIFEEE